MSRGWIDLHTRAIHGHDDNVVDTATLTPHHQVLAIGDLEIDCLLSAMAVEDSPRQADAFARAIVSRIRQASDAQDFAERVRRRLEKNRRARLVGAVASLVAALAAAFALVQRPQREPAPTRSTTSEFEPQSAFAIDANPRPSTADPPWTHSRQVDQKAAEKPLPALFLVGAKELSTSESMVAERLNLLGFRPEVRVAYHTELSAFSSYPLVLVSSSVNSKLVRPDAIRALASVPTALVIWEPWLFDDLGLADCPDNVGCGWAIMSGDGTLLSESGSEVDARPVVLSTMPVTLSFGKPLPSAQIVVRAESDTSVPVLFFYEKGAALLEDTAPARRVATFLSDDTARFLTDEGWALWDMGIQWAIRRR